MKFSVARGELVNALSTVSRGLSSRSTLPILSGILVTAESSGEVIFQTTDLEVSMKETLPLAGVDKPGAAVIPGKLLSDIVRALPEAAVTIDVENGMAAITCLQSSFVLRTLSPDDFPRFPEIKGEKMVKLPASHIKNLVRHVTKAVSRDETRPVLTGVLLTVESMTIKAVATDSYRLAVKESVLDNEDAQDIDVVIPAKVLEEVSRIAEENEAISLGITENQVVFSFGRTVFITRRIEGAFPNYRQLIPRESETTVSISREDLMLAAKRVSLLAQHNTPLRISVKAEDQTVSLSATTHDVGDASEDLMATVQGSDVEIAFNHAFLIDGLNACEGENVKLDIVSPLKPGVLTSPEDEGFLYLLMPVRLG